VVKMKLTILKGVVKEPKKKEEEAPQVAGKEQPRNQRILFFKCRDFCELKKLFL